MGVRVGLTARVCEGVGESESESKSGSGSESDNWSGSGSESESVAVPLSRWRGSVIPGQYRTPCISPMRTHERATSSNTVRASIIYVHASLRTIIVYSCTFPLWAGCCQSRRCSRDTYPDSYFTKYTGIRKKAMGAFFIALVRE